MAANLSARYPLSDKEIQDLVDRAVAEYEGLERNLHSYQEIQAYLLEHGAVLRAQVCERLRNNCGFQARLVVALVRHFMKNGMSEGDARALFNEQAGHSRALLRSLVGADEAINWEDILQQLVAAGVLNLLCHESSGGRTALEYTFGMVIPPVDLHELTSGLLQPDPEQFVGELFRDRLLVDAQVIDTVAPFGAICDGPLPVNPSRLSGVIGIDQEHGRTTVAVNPLIGARLARAIQRHKAERMAGDLRLTEAAFHDWAKGQGNGAVVTQALARGGDTVWRIDPPGGGTFLVYLSPWLTQDCLRRARAAGGVPVLYILTEQSLGSADAQLSGRHEGDALLRLSGTATEYRPGSDSPPEFWAIVHCLRTRAEAVVSPDRGDSAATAPHVPLRVPERRRNWVWHMRSTLASWLSP